MKLNPYLEWLQLEVDGVDVLLQLEGGPEAAAAVLAQVLLANVVRLQIKGNLI